MPAPADRSAARPRAHRIGFLATRSGQLYTGAGLVLLAVVFVLLLGMGMRKDINHDEHQFIAAGALIAREGMLPYVDFHYFHVPGLSYLYALAFQFTDRLLLTARGIAVTAAGAMLALLFFAPALLFPNATHRPAARHAGLAGAFVILLLISTQTFRYTTGWSWNHDMPVLLMCLACWLQIRLFAHREPPPSRYLWIGLLMGLATAMRASFALPALVFALFALPIVLSSTGTDGLRQPRHRRAAWMPLLYLGAGGVLGSAPAWIFFFLAPAQFVFGNFEYVRLNTAHYLESGGLQPGEGWAQKWEMTRNTMITVWRANFALVLLTAVQLIRLYKQIRPQRAPELVFLGVLILAALVSGYAPTPMQIQYIYLVFPLLALLNLALIHRDPMPRLGLTLLLVASLYAATQAQNDFRDSWRAAWQPSAWVVNQVHHRGQEIAALTGEATVITLAPIYPLEGGAPILPELVSGPFGWRVANLIEPSTRATMGIVGPQEMTQHMQTHPPRAILVGIHGAHAELEPSLIEFALARDYMPIPVEGFLPEPGTLWLAR